MEWTRKVLTQFIELYRSKPCLWQVKDSSYSDKGLKQQAYQELVNLLKANGLKDANENLVKTKIQNLRNAFRKEAKKFEASKNDKGAELYIPKLWYYNLLLFTKDQDTATPSMDKLRLLRNYTVDDISLDENDDDTTDVDELETSYSPKEIDINSDDVIFLEPVLTYNHIRADDTPVRNTVPKKDVMTSDTTNSSSLKRKRLLDDSDDQIRKATNIVQNSSISHNPISHRFNIFGQYVGSSLQDIKNPKVQIELEHNILKAIMHAQMKDI